MIELLKSIWRELIGIILTLLLAFSLWYIGDVSDQRDQYKANAELQTTLLEKQQILAKLLADNSALLTEIQHKREILSTLDTEIAKKSAKVNERKQGIKPRVAALDEKQTLEQFKTMGFNGTIR